MWTKHRFLRKLVSRRTACLAGVAIAALVAGEQRHVQAANPSADLDQWANLDNAWVNGNLGTSKSTYFEGDSIPYRLRFNNLSIGTHHVIVEWDTTKASKHAIDVLTTFNRLVGKVPNAPNPPLNPCAGVTNCVYGTNSTKLIPADPQVTGAGVTPPAGNFTIWGGTIGTISAYAYLDGTGFAGDKSARLDIEFTTTRANPVLAWGGRIATRKDWGNGNAAVAISGSPYHTRLIDLDGSGGNQDRSLSAAAVIFPALINITKDVQTAAGGAATDAQAFLFTGSGQVPASLNLFDDGSLDNPDQTPQTGSIELDAFGNANQEVVTETTYAAFTQSASCSVTDAGVGGGSQSVNGIVATVTPVEGMVVDCLFVNKIKNATLTVKKHVVNDNGGQAQASAFSLHVKAGGTDVTGSPANGDENGTQYSLPAGTYVVSENTPPTGYTQTGISGDCNAAGSVTLAAGESKTCTITNDDVSPSLTLKKVVNNANGGTAKPENFTLTATGTTSTLSGKPAANQDSITGNVDAGSYTLSESTIPTGYTADGPYSCVVNGGSAVVSNSLTLVPGDVATCTIKNNDAKAAPSGETVQRAILHDKITITGIRTGGSGTVTVTFRLYSDSGCSALVGSEQITGALPANGEVTTVTGIGPVAKSATITAYYWRVEYSGDSFNTGFNTACSNEITTISFNK